MSRRGKRIGLFEVEIERLGPKGVGVGTAPDGRPVQVRRAPPGARILVRPTGRKAGVWKGERAACVRPSLDAVAPGCGAFGLCGGCALQELPLDRQRALKLERAREEVGPAEWVGIRGAPDPYGYRNKMEFSFGVRRYLDERAHAAGEPIDGRFLGLHASGRFDRVVDLPVCPLLDDAGNAVLHAVRQATLVPSAPEPWDVRAHTGFLRHLLIRRGDGSVGVGLFTTSPDPAQRAFVEGLLDALIALEVPGARVAGVWWFVNDGVADVATGSLEAHRGDPSLRITLRGRTFDLAPLAFFQTSTAGAELLIDAIGDALGTGHRLLLDLYCGTGSIGICLADRADAVRGIELVEDAVLNARANARSNGVQGQWDVAKVEDALHALSGGPGVAAVVDPPRVGLHPSVARALAEAALDVLVYVACNPASLGRDRVVLEAGGWTLERCEAVDLFPQTGHLEVVARFTRAPP